MYGKKILVTGGCGYIGAHTIVDLIENGFEVISVDNLSRGNEQMLIGIEKITNVKVKNYKINLCNLDDTEALFMEHPDIEGIIHFAAYKSVPESVAEPLLYFENNLQSLNNILKCAVEFNVAYFIFSSSCSVYGNALQAPVTENTPLLEAECPYARTKQIGEMICKDTAKFTKDLNIISLRYFNPVGAHPSAHIGEMQKKPENLVPVITQTAIGNRPSLSVFGNDYPTRDGSCIRDYIHVMDIAAAHTKALQYLMKEKNETAYEVFNLGTGNGVTVLELIQSFEKTTNQKLNYVIENRRAGDVVSIFANNELVKSKINWKPQYSIDQMMLTAWNWEQKMNEK